MAKGQRDPSYTISKRSGAVKTPEMLSGGRRTVPTGLLSRMEYDASSIDREDSYVSKETTTTTLAIRPRGSVASTVRV